MDGEGGGGNRAAVADGGGAAKVAGDALSPACAFPTALGCLRPWCHPVTLRRARR